MKKYVAFVLAVILILVYGYCFADSTDWTFGNGVTFGDDINTVLSVEGVANAVLHKDDKYLIYTGKTIDGIDGSSIVYLFNDDWRLLCIVYIYGAAKGNQTLTEFVTDYYNIFGKLFEKYYSYKMVSGWNKMIIHVGSALYLQAMNGNKEIQSVQYIVPYNTDMNVIIQDSLSATSSSYDSFMHYASYAIMRSDYATTYLDYKNSIKNQK